MTPVPQPPEHWYEDLIKEGAEALAEAGDC